MRAAILSALLALGCAKTVAELSPINCTANGQCPSPYVCYNNTCIEGIHCNTMDPSACPSNRPRCTLTVVTDSTFDSQCVPLEGAGTAGASCQMEFVAFNAASAFPWADRSCAGKHICHDFYFALPGSTDTTGRTPSCRAFCARDADCSAGQRCLDAFGKRYLPLYTGPAPASGVCIAECAMFASGVCTGGLGCAPVLDVDGVTAFGTCMAAGIGDVGDLCNLANPACKAGLGCVPTATGLQCLPACKPGGTPACAAGKTCDTTLIQMTGVGFCH